MKIVRFVDEAGRVCLGRDPLSGTAELLDGHLFGKLKPSGQRTRIRALLAPVSPPNIFGVGLNYREHARQSGAEIPEQPFIL